MKRLKNILLSMDNKTSTYREMYEGPIFIVPEEGIPYEDSDNVYYDDSIGYKITRTNKLALDKPTITIQIPVDLIGIRKCSIAAADYCLRSLKPYIERINDSLFNRSRPDSENGKFHVYNPGGEVLVRNTSFFWDCIQKDYESGAGVTVFLTNKNKDEFSKMCLCVVIQAQLPSKRIKKTIQMLCKDLPAAVNAFVSEFDVCELETVYALEDKQTGIREWLGKNGYCAFIANGSILPRVGGSDQPLPDAVPFSSAPNHEIEICGVCGMGIKCGVTVISGGGYSGKSTLLDAIAAGIYNHVLGDGRELCITDSSAMTIVAEDGRSIKSVNISPFIQWLPKGDPHNFTTDNASGSTSQAANIMEAINCGSKLLLIDEDRSATNFMIRDNVMRELVNKEPITPFTDRAQELYQTCGVSTVLVIGGSGEYLPVADEVFVLDGFQVKDETKKAKDICKKHKYTRSVMTPAVWTQKRVLYSEGFTSYPKGSGSEKLEVSAQGFIFMGDEEISVRSLLNIVTKNQLDSIGYMLRYIAIKNTDEIIDSDIRIKELYNLIEDNKLDCIYSGFFTKTERFLDLPRPQELLAVINRMRMIKMKTGEN